jgi:hypothetical protein
MLKQITECVSQDKSYPNKNSKRIPISQGSDDLTLLSDNTKRVYLGRSEILIPNTRKINKLHDNIRVVLQPCGHAENRLENQVGPRADLDAKEARKLTEIAQRLPGRPTLDKSLHWRNQHTSRSLQYYYNNLNITADNHISKN